MNYRTLGRTGLSVSEIGFGCGNVGGLMIRGKHAAQVKAVARAMELGINYFDTASQYGAGQSETNLGRVLKELNAQVYVVTKFRLETEDDADIKGSVIRSVDGSLSRMARKQVDLVQLHNRVSPQRDLAGDRVSTCNLGNRFHHRLGTTAGDPPFQGRTRAWFFLQDRLQDLCHQPVVPPGSIIGSNAEIETGLFEIIQPRQVSSTASAITEGHLIAQRAGDTSQSGLAPEVRTLG